VWRQELEESPFERIFSSSVTEIELQPEGEGQTRVELTAVQRLRGRFRLGSFMVRRASKRLLDEALDGIERSVAPA
jgi:carbon monoxide dehydrogenase subunit G